MHIPAYPVKHLPRILMQLLLLAGVATTTAVGPLRAEDSKPTNIGSRLELFVDDALIDHQRNVTLQLHEPAIAETVMTWDFPWEGSNNGYITIFKDDAKYRMYYRAVAGTGTPASGDGWIMNGCYAESDDGIHWTRPNLGLVEFKGSKQNNIIWPSEKNGEFGIPADNFTPFVDTNPAALPSQKYKALAGSFGFKPESHYRGGFWAYASPDAIHWTKLQEKSVLGPKQWPAYGDGSHIPTFWSPREGCYVAYVRIRIDQDKQPIHWQDDRSIRWVGRTTSKDFVNWTKVVPLDYGDAPAEHFYTNAISPYFRAPHHYLGFPMRFLPDRNATLPAKYDASRGVGLSDTVFVSSRDGQHFDRRFMESLVRPGIDLLNWVDRSGMTCVGLVPTGPTEMSIYVVEHNRLPTHRLRRRVFRTDGIVSVHAPYAGGELVTKPIVFTGDELVVNCSTSAAGDIRVEILDADSRPIEGYTQADADGFFGDSIDHSLTWNGKTDVSPLAGKPIRLRFLLQDADLYSYQFQK